MKRITTTNEIQSYDGSNIVISGNERIVLSGDFTVDDFEDKALITKEVVIGMIDEQDPANADLIPQLWINEPGQPNVGVPVPLDGVRFLPIAGRYYLFVSAMDNNTTKPAFGIGEWEPLSPDPATAGLKVNVTGSNDSLVYDADTDSYYMPISIAATKRFLSCYYHNVVAGNQVGIRRYKSISDLTHDPDRVGADYWIGGFTEADKLNDDLIITVELI